MAKQANAMLIGGFVVLAVGILAVSIVLFGSGNFFAPMMKRVMFFQGSIKGLEVGAPVLFRGVQVGQVTQIIIKAHLKDTKTYIPVFIEIDERKFVVVDEDEDYIPADQEEMDRLIEKGLRGVLSMQSLITGKLVIELEFMPDTPVHLTHHEPQFIEIPTVKSGFYRLGKALESLDLEKIQNKLMSVLDGADKIVNDPDLKASIAALRATLENANHLVTHVDSKVDPLTDNLNQTLTDARGQINTVGDKAGTALTSYNRLANHLDSKVDPLSDSLEETLAEARIALKQATETLKVIEEDLEPDSPLMYELENTLREFSAAARSIRLLADYLKRHPESILQGKGQAKKTGGE